MAKRSTPLPDRRDPLRSSSPRQRLRDSLLGQIEGGVLREGDRIPSLRDLAERFGIAYVTAQKTVRALRDEGRLITRVGSGAYVAPRQDRIGRGTSHCLYFVYDKKLQTQPGSRLNHFYLGILNGAQECAAAHGYDLLYKPVQHGLSGSLLKEISDPTRCAGVLLVGEEWGRAPNALALDNDIPTVFVDCYDDLEGHTIAVDIATGVAQAVATLVGLGHERLAFLGHSSELPSIREKTAAFCQTTAKFGLSRENVRVVIMKDATTLTPDITALLAGDPAPTAILFGTDDEALAAMDVLEGKAGRDVGIVGCDDIEPARARTPALSSIHVDKEEMGRAAVDVLLRNPRRPRTVRVLSRYIDRETTPAPMQASAR